ncbi:aminoacyl-tRNA synthetase [Glaciimonas sp. PAMC28666]|uniref:aminoacyl-tRNA synthetase n=1 Tax=Glaciimonas sp. PAMC28666 TaxID=2807626 RepID=UPI001963CEC2|nr:aminoacyl-tRNA synthetase [Glaciimonas sp. PAMC28666]QRX84344.1 aminoacyl-tRNA synthetase [Glaciimonas sp. PAMC28666]
MRMSDEEYFRSCVAKERRLAQLLGYDNIEECYERAGTLLVNTDALPQWTRNWKACGPLIAAYDISIHYGKDPAHEHGDAVICGGINVPFSDHPTKDRAIMFAIVKAVIVLLEHAKCHAVK